MPEEVGDLSGVRNRESLRRLDTGMEITRATKHEPIDFDSLSKQELKSRTDAARRIGELLSELSSILPASAPVVKIAHAGQDDFDFYTARGDLIELHDSPSPQFSFDVYAALQAISQEVQFEFIRQRRLGKVAG